MRIRIRVSLLLFLALPAATSSSGAAVDAAAVNLQAAPCAALRQGAEAAGVALTFDAATPFDHLPSILIWQADERGRRLTPEEVTQLQTHLARGHALLLTLARQPGLDAFRLTPVSPTTAWQTLLPKAYRGGAAPAVGAGKADREFFSRAPDFQVPYQYRLRPVHTAELGETRLEQLARRDSYLQLPFAPGEPFLSRPLLNRDWQVRLAADDQAAEALLLTGRYGAGRVAVYASGAESGTPEFWRAVFTFLRGATPAAPVPAARPTFTFAIDEAKRQLLVTGNNPRGPDWKLPVVARLYGWDGTLQRDLTGDLELPAGRENTLVLSIPDAGILKAQAQSFRDQYRIRVGVLAPSGGEVWRETTLTADFTPPLEATLSGSEPGSNPAPLPGPEPESLALQGRGGLPVSDYSYRAGSEQRFTLTVRNGRRNLAPRARVLAPGAGNPEAARILNNLAASQMRPRGDLLEGGFYEGCEQAENRIRFEFPQPVTLNGLALYGTYERNATLVNTPGAIRVLADGREVLRRDDLDAGFNRRHLRTSLNWSPATARVWELVFPWRAAPAGLRRVKLQLGEIELFGPTPEVTAQNLELKLRLIRFGKPALELGSLRLSVPPGGEVRHEFACRLPELNGEAPDFGRLEAVTADGRVLAELPLLLVSDREGSCLRSRTSIQPPGQSWRIDHIVTRGFRNWLPLGSGSRDTPAGGWSTPEDIVFAYACRIKQTGSGTATDPAKLFLSEHSFTHYGNPWGSFPNGQLFFEAAAPRFLDRVRNLSAWQNAKLIVLGFGDRWDTGPSLNSMYSWQELVEFDRFRRQQGLDGLRGRTRAELIADLNKRLLHPFHAWQLDRYLRSFRAIRETIEGTGRRFGINAQGIPLLPPEAAAEIGSRLRGMSDDDTWGGLEEDFPLTAGRQMIHLAFNPGWQLVSNLVWGWDNTCLNNPHWFMPVGTTESSRRHQVTRAWRGVVGDRGDYHSIHTFGYSMNGYNSPLATVNDWQQNWNAAERQTRILPDGPLGFGLVVGTAVLSDPERAVFSGGGMGDSRLADTLIGRLFRVIGELHRRRISLPFAANATALMKFPGRSPLILPMPSTLSPEERKFLVERSRRGGALVLITDGETPAPEFQPLFADARPLPGEPRFRVGSAGIVADFRLEQLDGRAYDQLAALIREHLSPELIYPGGTAGYGFTSRGRKFITVEDLREEARTVQIQLRATGSAARAMELNTHHELPIVREGDFWNISLPLRKGDGVLIVVEEI